MPCVIFIVILFIFIFMQSAYAYEDENFCVREISLPEPVGAIKDAVKESPWRAVSEITIFPNSPHALFFGYGHSAMRLNGYALEPITDQLPYNTLVHHDFYYGPVEGRIYAHTFRIPPFYAYMDNETGDWIRIPETETKGLKEKLRNIFWSPYVEKIIGNKEQSLHFDTRHNVIKIDDKEVEGIYMHFKSTGSDRLARNSWYVPQLKQIYVTGFKKITNFWIIPDKWEGRDYGTFYWDNTQWKKLISPNGDDIFGINGYSDRLGVLFLTSAEIFVQGDYEKLRNHAKSKNYFMKEGKLIEFDNRLQHDARLIDLPSLNKTIFVAKNRIFSINENFELTEVEMPFIGKRPLRLDVTEVPSGKYALIRSIPSTVYLMDKDLKVSPEPLLPEFFSSDEPKLRALENIPVRDEIFVSTYKGYYMLIDKRIHGAENCHD